MSSSSSESSPRAPQRKRRALGTSTSGDRTREEIERSPSLVQGRNTAGTPSVVRPADMTRMDGSVGVGLVQEILLRTERNLLASLQSAVSEQSKGHVILEKSIEKLQISVQRLLQLTSALLFSSPTVSTKNLSPEAAAQSVTVENFVGQNFMRKVLLANFVVFFLRFFPHNSVQTTRPSVQGEGSFSSTGAEIRQHEMSREQTSLEARALAISAGKKRKSNPLQNRDVLYTYTRVYIISLIRILEPGTRVSEII